VEKELLRQEEAFAEFEREVIAELAGQKQPSPETV
jgi:hypothetical protein